jgi:hypothetical protein
LCQPHRSRFLPHDSASTISTSPPQKDDNQLEITLAAVEQGADGKLVLTTTDGAIWRQAERMIRVLPYGNEDSQELQRTSKGGCG